MRSPTARQLEYCYDLLEKVGLCESDEDGQPLFELSFEAADAFIKQNKKTRKRTPEDFPAPGTWGGKPDELH